MKLPKKRSLFVALAAALLVLCVAWFAVYFAGSVLSAPAPSFVGAAPSDLPVEAIEFESDSGSRIRGWWIPAEGAGGVIILAHGLRGNRRAMLGRARFLHEAGFSTLLFDTQAHGESSGERITFGVLESHDARAATRYARSRRPEARLGYIGVSLGGAAVLLGSKQLEVDALVLESVYPTLREATHNRIAMRLGGLARWVTPLLLTQVEPRLGVEPDSVAPIVSIRQLRTPVLLIAGALDEHTTLSQSKRLFEAAPPPKELWILPKAAHVDFHAASTQEYERRIVAFFRESGF